MSKKNKSSMMHGPMPSKESQARENKYRAEDDLRTLSRADEVRSDPSRMAHARTAHREQMDSLSRVGRSMGGRDPKKGRGRRRSRGRRRR